MTTPSQAASELLSLFVTPGPAYGGARPYRTFPVLPAGDGLGRFPGTLQAAFLAAGYQLSDLVAGLAYAVTEGWLALVQTYTGGMQEYALLQAGFAEASGTAPTMAQSAQQLINTLVNVEGGTAFAQTYKLETLVSNFVGT